MNTDEKPITPAEVIAKKRQITAPPSFVIKVFNELIVKNFTNNKAIISREEAINAICSHVLNFGFKNYNYNYEWLNSIEEIYSRYGWNVSFYDQDGSLFFSFTRRVSPQPKADYPVC